MELYIQKCDENNLLIGYRNINNGFIMLNKTYKQDKFIWNFIGEMTHEAYNEFLDNSKKVTDLNLITEYENYLESIKPFDSSEYFELVTK